MMPCIPAPRRDRLDVGFPDFIGSGKAAEAALHERRAFAQDQSVSLYSFIGSCLPSTRESPTLASLPATESV